MSMYLLGLATGWVVFERPEWVEGAISWVKGAALAGYMWIKVKIS